VDVGSSTRTRTKLHGNSVKDARGRTAPRETSNELRGFFENVMTTIGSMTLRILLEKKRMRLDFDGVAIHCNIDVALRVQISSTRTKRIPWCQIVETVASVVISN